MPQEFNFAHVQKAEKKKKKTTEKQKVEMSDGQVSEEILQLCQKENLHGNTRKNDEKDTHTHKKGYFD